MRAVCTIFAFALIACGSKGGAARLTVTPLQLTVTADGSKSSTPSAAINVTLVDPPPGGVYVGAGFTKNGIAGMNFTSSGTQGEFTVFFKDPSTVAVGTYSDTIQIGLCTDASCSHSVAGTLVTVAITYVVTVDATATLMKATSEFRIYKLKPAME